MNDLLEKKYPGLKRITTRSLNRAVEGARHRFIPVPGTEDKLRMLKMARLHQRGQFVLV